MFGILELVRGTAQPPVHTGRNWSEEDTANLQTRARDFNCHLCPLFPENKQENSKAETSFG